MTLQNPRSIAILLSTYNSGDYLSEQLDSLLSQTCDDWTLYIRDDGSTDSTLDILAQYAQKHEQIIICYDKQSNLGAAQSFMALLSLVDSKYYMFCDHDDIWLSNKITIEIIYIQSLEKKYSNKPLLVGTDLAVVDSSCNVISPSLFQYARVCVDKILKNKKYLFVVNPFVGCTLLFNDAAKRVVFPLSKDIIMHDWWIALKVCEFGVCDIIKQSTILYRQHGSNVVGTQNIDNSFGYWRKKIVNISSSLRSNLRIARALKGMHYSSIPYFWYLKFKYLINR